MSDGFTPHPVNQTEFAAINNAGFPEQFATTEHLLEAAEATANSNVSPTDIENQVKEAFEQGFTEGQKDAELKQNIGTQSQEVLAKAIEKLRPVDAEKLSDLLLETLIHLLKQAVGEMGVDRELLQARCQNAVDLIDHEIGEPTLFVAPSDFEFLMEWGSDIDFSVRQDLLPGSVVLEHKEGRVIAGTSAILEQLGNLSIKPGGCHADD